MKNALILLHGALGSAAQFDALRARFPENETVYAMDFPGHGLSSPDAVFSLPFFTETILRFMDENHLDKADFFGYSMGGYVALYLAATHPARVGELRTLGTKLEWTPEVAAGMNRMFDPEKIEAKVPAFAQTLEAMHADWKALCRYTAAFLTDLGNGLGLKEEMFSSITCPVTIGWGTADQVVSRAESERVATLIPGAMLAELPEVKHQLEFIALDDLFKFVQRRDEEKTTAP